MTRGYSIKDKKLYLKGVLNGIKFRPQIRLTNLIYDIKIRHNNTEKYIAILIGKDVDKSKITANKKEILSLDLGLEDYYVTSENTRVPHPKWSEKYSERLNKITNKINELSNDSEYRKILIVERNKLYEKIKNQRLDFLHKNTTLLTASYKTIVMEDLNIKNMLLHYGLRDKIFDSSWYNFKKLLTYKARDNDCLLIFAPKYFASSKTCSMCGYKNNSLFFNDRGWICSKCGVSHDRDLNACFNLLKYGRLNKVRETF